jgi:hypothetical protein
MRIVPLLALLALACNTSDQLIVSHDDAASGGPVATGGSPAGTGGAAGGGPVATGGSAAGTGGTATGGSGGTGGTGLPADAAANPDTPAAAPPADAASADAPARADATVAGEVGFGSLTCADLPSCGAGSECMCCPLGLRVSHCTCAVACTMDSECPAAAPHCNVKKTMGIPIGKGFCTTDTFVCLW